MERFVDPQGAKRSIGEFGRSEPQILAFRGAQQEKAESRTAGHEIDEQQNIRGKDGPESAPDLEGLPLAQKSGVPDANGCLGSSSQGVLWLPRIYPNADGDGERPTRGGQILGEGNEPFASNSKTKCQLVFRRQSAKLANQSAAGEYLVVPKDYGNEQGQGRAICREENLKAVPCEAAITRVALPIPRLVGAQQLPRGIVEVGVGPTGIIACVEAPEVMDFDHRDALVLEVHDLGRREFCTDENEKREGEEDRRAPLPTPGKHDWDGCITGGAAQWKSAAREAVSHPNAVWRRR